MTSFGTVQARAARRCNPRRDGRGFLARAARHRLQVSTTPYPVDRTDAVLDGGGVDLSRSITGVKQGPPAAAVSVLPVESPPLQRHSSPATCAHREGLHRLVESLA